MNEQDKIINKKVSFIGRFRRFFFTGFLVTAPILITLYVTWIVITFIDAKVANLTACQR